MRDAISNEFRRQVARIEAAERRLAMMVMSGKVGPKDPDRRRLRLKLGKNSKGEDVLSPWIRWQEPAAGALSIHSEPGDNEQMLMVSMSGTIGETSIAMPSTYDRDHQAPSKASDATVLARGNARLEMTGEGFTLTGNISFRGGTVTHDEVPIGKTHKHKDVLEGAAISGVPIP